VGNKPDFVVHPGEHEPARPQGPGPGDGDDMNQGTSAEDPTWTSFSQGRDHNIDGTSWVAAREPGCGAPPPTTQKPTQHTTQTQTTQHHPTIPTTNTQKLKHQPKNQKTSPTTKNPPPTPTTANKRTPKQTQPQKHPPSKTKTTPPPPPHPKHPHPPHSRPQAPQTPPPRTHPTTPHPTPHPPAAETRASESSRRCRPGCPPDGPFVGAIADRNNQVSECGRETTTPWRGERGGGGNSGFVITQVSTVAPAGLGVGRASGSQVQGR